MRDRMIEQVLRLVNREVWIVTAANGKRAGGLVATWVSQASIDAERPALMVGIAPNHFTAELIDASGAMCVHLITSAEIELAWNFAIGSGRDRDKLAEISYQRGITGSPRLNNCLAWLECRVFARHDTGDRNYYWAEIVAAGQPTDGVALCEHELFALASDEQRAALIAGRDADISIQRPKHDAWRAGLPQGNWAGQTGELRND